MSATKDTDSTWTRDRVTVSDIQCPRIIPWWNNLDRHLCVNMTKDKLNVDERSCDDE